MGPPAITRQDIPGHGTLIVECSPPQVAVAPLPGIAQVLPTSLRRSSPMKSQLFHRRSGRNKAHVQAVRLGQRGNADAGTTPGVSCVTCQSHGPSFSDDRHRIWMAVEIAIAISGRLGRGQGAAQCHDCDDFNGVRHAGVLSSKCDRFRSRSKDYQVSGLGKRASRPSRTFACVRTSEKHVREQRGATACRRPTLEDLPFFRVRKHR